MPEIPSTNAGDMLVPVRRSRRSRWIPAAGFGVALLVLTAAAVPMLLLNDRSMPATTAGRQTSAAQAATPATSATTTADQLRALAEAIHTSPADVQIGRYSYHHIRRWILDTTGTPVPPPMRENTPAVFAVEIRRWAAEDGSGCTIETELDPDYRLTGADPDHRSTSAEFARVRAVRTDHPAGELGSPIRLPLATDPATLALQLAAVDPMPDGPQSMLRAVDMLYTGHHVPLPVRAAALQVLGDMDGLSYQQTAADRLGRTGFAVSLNSRNIRYTLVFDPATGYLLASEQRLIGPHDFLHVPTGLVTYYTLFLDQGRRAELPPSCAAGRR